MCKCSVLDPRAEGRWSLSLSGTWWRLLSLSLPGTDAVCRDVDVAHAVSPLFMAFCLGTRSFRLLFHARARGEDSVCASVCV